MNELKFKYGELSQKTDSELNSHLVYLKKFLLQSRFSVVMKEIKDTSVFKKARVAIARVRTEINSRRRVK